jgi:hypothetical protein
LFTSKDPESRPRLTESERSYEQSHLIEDCNHEDTLRRTRRGEERRTYKCLWRHELLVPKNGRLFCTTTRRLASCV